MANNKDPIAGSGSLPNSFGAKTVKERISFDEQRNENYLEEPNRWGLTNAKIGVKLEGVKNADKIRHDKSDYTPSNRKDKT